MLWIYRAGSFSIGLVLLISGAVASAAQGLPGGASSLNETHGDWTVSCTVPEGNVRCAMAQTQLSGENRQRLLAIELQASESGANIGGTLVLPFGLRLDDGVSLAIDEQASVEPLRFSTCLPVGCLVPLTFDADMASALRAGSVLNVKAATSDTGQEVALSISLTGFASALSRTTALAP